MHTDAPMLLALRLTAITLLLRPMGPWSVRPLILMGAGAALLFPRMLESWATWLAISALIAVRIAVDWPLPDNHVFLLAYWCLAIALALGAADPTRTLAASGRLLLGVAFLCAVIWKGMLSPQYLDGRFFRVTLLTDPRFEHVVQLVTGLSGSDLDHNRATLAPLPEGAELVDPPRLIEPPAFTQFVRLSTAGLLAGEALLAATCLLPLAGIALMAGHVLLILFCALTYAVAPVAGFGWLLLCIGAALCRSDQRLLRGAYVGAWFLVLAYSEVPWARSLLAAIGERS